MPDSDLHLCKETPLTVFMKTIVLVLVELCLLNNLIGSEICREHMCKAESAIQGYKDHMY